MKKLLLITVCLLLATALIGCGTVKGIGGDIATVGGWVSKTSEVFEIFKKEK